MADQEHMSDEDLMARIQNADHQAFAVLVTRHTQRFFVAAYRMNAHVQEAEDIVQDAFLKLWDKPQMWDASKGVKFTTWFYRVVTNLAIDKMRKKTPIANSEMLDVHESGAPSAESALYQKQREEILEEAIQNLPDRQKVALNLCMYEGLSQKEAADVLGVNIKALESLLSRAKAGLKAKLEQAGLITCAQENIRTGTQNHG